MRKNEKKQKTKSDKNLLFYHIPVSIHIASIGLFLKYYNYKSDLNPFDEYFYQMDDLVLIFEGILEINNNYKCKIYR